MMLYTIPPLGKMMQYIPFTLATSVNRGTIQSTYTYTYTYTYTPYVERVTIYSWQKKKKKKTRDRSVTHLTKNERRPLN